MKSVNVTGYALCLFETSCVFWGEGAEEGADVVCFLGEEAEEGADVVCYSATSCVNSV